MSENSQMIFTEAGLAAIESSTEAGLSLEITHIALGDGEGGSGYAVRDGSGIPLNSAKSQSVLKGEKWRGTLNASSDASNYQLSLRAVIEAGTPEFYVREVGVYAGDVLVALWSSAQGNLGFRSSGAELVFDFVMAWSDLPSGALTVVFDENTAVEGVRLRVEKVADYVDAMRITKKRVFAYHEGEVLAHAVHPLVAEDLPEDLSPPLTISETGFDPDLMEADATKRYLVCYFFTDNEIAFITSQRLDNHDDINKIKDIFDNRNRGYESAVYDENGLPIESFTANWTFSDAQRYATQTDGTFSSDDGVWGVVQTGVNGNYQGLPPSLGYYYGNFNLSDRDAQFLAGTKALDATKASVIAVITDRHLALAQATEGTSGVIELASSTEVQTGTSSTHAVTPAGLSARTATQTRTGLVELASSTEVQTGTSSTHAVTPAALQEKVHFGENAGKNDGATGVTYKSPDVALGDHAARNNTGDYVVGVGESAARDNTGSYVVGVGDHAAGNNTGIEVVGLGHLAVYNNTGDNVVGMGRWSVYNNTGDNVVGMGRWSVYNNTGNYVVGVGERAAWYNTGDNVLGVGTNAAYSNTGNYVVGVGDHAAWYNTGDNVLGVGANAARYNTGGNVLGVGANAARDNTGDNVVGVGESAARDNAGDDVLSVGYYAAHNNTGNNVVGVGERAADVNTGNYVVGVGEHAARDNTYNRVVCLGSYARVSGHNQVQLGSQGSYLGISYQTDVYGKSFNQRSDQRDKTDIANINLGLDFIKKLRPVTFVWDHRDFYKDYEEVETEEQITDSETGEVRTETRTEVTVTEVPKDGSRKEKRHHTGLIAQEVKQAMDELGVDFAGYQDHKVNGGDDVLSLDYATFVPVLIKAVQELKAEIDELKNNKGRTS